MSQFIKFYFTSSVLNMFRTLIHPSSGACNFSIVSPHWLCVLVSMCVGVSVWLVWVVSVWQAEAEVLFHFFYARHVSDINTSIIRSLRLFYCVLQPATRIPPQPATPKLQHTSKKEHTTNVVIQ